MQGRKMQSPLTMIDSYSIQNPAKSMNEQIGTSILLAAAYKKSVEIQPEDNPGAFLISRRK